MVLSWKVVEADMCSLPKKKILVTGECSRHNLKSDREHIEVGFL